LIFDLDGHYKHKIAGTGVSKQEYVRINDIHTNNNTIYLLDIGTKRILEYDVNNNFINSNNLDCFLYSFLPVDEGYWGISYYSNKERYNLVLLNKEKNEIVKGYFQCENNLPIRPCNNFVTNDITKESFFYYPYNDTIYRIENNEIKPFIHIDFGNKK